MKKSAHKGFTLIELLVVIAIIGVLAAVVLIAINPARRLAQGRDSGRKSDIGQLATSLQAYFTTNSAYPAALSDLVTSEDLKTLPKTPTTGDYTYVLNTDSTEAAVYDELEAPTTSGFAASTAVWCYETATGRAAEEASAGDCTAP